MHAHFTLPCRKVFDVSSGDENDDLAVYACTSICPWSGKGL